MDFKVPEITVSFKYDFVLCLSNNKKQEAHATSYEFYVFF